MGNDEELTNHLHSNSVMKSMIGSPFNLCQRCAELASAPQLVMSIEVACDGELDWVCVDCVVVALHELSTSNIVVPWPISKRYCYCDSDPINT